MAHHGNDFLTNEGLSEFAKQFQGSQPKDLSELLKNQTPDVLGATGKFPDGKITSNDEGEIMIGITEKDGTVIMNFGKPVSWMGCTKEQAKQIAESLLKHSQ